jgi:hypothetical protein
MIRNEQSFSQDRLPASVRNFCKQVGFAIRHQFLHGFQISRERL